MEMLAVAQANDKPALTTRLAEFRKNFVEIGVGKIFELLTYVFTNKVSKYTFLFKPELRYEICDLKLGIYVLILF